MKRIRRGGEILLGLRDGRINKADTEEGRGRSKRREI